MERRAPGQPGEKPIPGLAALAVVPSAAASRLHGFLPNQSPTRQSGNQPWLARLPGAGAAWLSAYRHALARRSGGRSSPLSLALHCSLPPEALSAGHAPQSRIATPSTLPGRIQLPAQPPYHADQPVSPPRAGLSYNRHYHLVNCRAGSSLIFIYIYYPRSQTDPSLCRVPVNGGAALPVPGAPKPFACSHWGTWRFGDLYHQLER